MTKEKLNSNKIIKKIEERSNKIKNFSVRKIALFGSYAKNRQKKKSDIDILVTFKKETFDNYVDLLLLLERIFKRKIDLVIEKNLRPEFSYVKKEARYAR